MNDVLQAKATTIERCMMRIREESRQDWKNDYSQQDALVLNLERACQATIDVASHLVRIKKLGMSKLTRELWS